MKCSNCGKSGGREAIPGTGLILCSACIAEADRR